MMRQRPWILLALAAVAAPVFAGVAVESSVVRKGIYQATGCVAEANPQLYNECICAADISKARVTGLAPEILASINNQLASVPEQLANESCEGVPATAPAGAISYNRATANFKVAHQTPHLLTMLIIYSTYGAGAAHPLDGTEGFTFDLATGKTIDPLQYLTSEQLAKANMFASQELLKKYGDMLFDETKLRTDPYLTEAGCDTCTLFYGKEGWVMRFQLYAIAPYASGEPEIIFPAEIIPAPETLIAKK